MLLAFARAFIGRKTRYVARYLLWNCEAYAFQRSVTRIVPNDEGAALIWSGGSLWALPRFSHLCFDAPELKAMGTNGLFDRLAGKVVRRSVLGCDHSNRAPGAKPIRQLAARGVSGESPQAGVCIWFEDIESHAIILHWDSSGQPRAAVSLQLCEAVLAVFSVRRSVRPVLPACGQACGHGAPPRLFLVLPSPMASHRSAAASFRGTRLRAAFSSSRRAEPDRRYCHEREYARILLRRHSKRIGHHSSAHAEAGYRSRQDRAECSAIIAPSVATILRDSPAWQARWDAPRDWPSSWMLSLAAAAHVGLGDSRIDESRNELALLSTIAYAEGWCGFRSRAGKAKRAHPTTFLYGYNPP